MKKLLLAFFIIFLTCSLKAQILIGLSENEIVDYMEEKYPNFVLNTGFGATQTTVKFYDSKNDRTIIFFLDDKGKCAYSKLMLDMEEYDKTVTAMNNSKSFMSVGENRWVQRKGDYEYVLKIDKTKWMFSLITKRKE